MAKKEDEDLKKFHDDLGAKYSKEIKWEELALKMKQYGHVKTPKQCRERSTNQLASPPQPRIIQRKVDPGRKSTAF